MSDNPEPWVPNFEGAPKLMYEVWSWPEPQPEPFYQDVDLSKNNWHFIGYRTLTLRGVMEYRAFGYHVERSQAGDRHGAVPLFPRLDSSGPDTGQGLD